eukprot:TRINITY_DN5346_c0_g2_i1.p1 TRINITY_DN5346_c0_g2~~TRINITY_DN5346_c0_g2_i1.p1  ORF type:complete len:364 (-),score=30.35 TRINITY_DN5346_c0_g2_i1:33-1124(-)
MDSESILADLASLISKNDPILACLATPLHQASKGNSPNQPKSDNKLKIILNAQRLRSARESEQLNLSPSHSARNLLLNDKPVNKRQGSGLRLRKKKSTPGNYTTRKNAPSPLEQFEDSRAQANAQLPKKETILAPAASTTRKLAAGKKLQDYLRKNPYEKLSKKGTVLLEKQENCSLSPRGSPIAEPGKRQLKVIRTDAIKSGLHKKPQRMPSPRPSRRPELNTSDSKPKTTRDEKSLLKREESGNCKKTSRNNQLPLTHGKQTYDPKRAKDSSSPRQEANKQKVRNHLGYLIKRIEHEKELKEKATNKRRQKLEECISEAKQKLLRGHVKNKQSADVVDSSIGDTSKSQYCLLFTTCIHCSF